MRTYVKSPYLVPFDGSFRLSPKATKPPKDRTKAENLEALAANVEQLDDLQQRLYADDRFSMLLVFQAMDAAGKDGAVRALLRGVNPAGCEVSAFKAPSAEELDHDFLWRVTKRLPERGRIGVWNRSHYEEVLVVRVNPQFIAGQRIPHAKPNRAFWQARFESIVDAERHWAQNGTVVLKFFLHVSPKEQRERLIERAEDPAAQWKFRASDVDTRAQWPAYMKAYEGALAATSRPWAPWYVVPADSKSYARATISDIVVRTLDALHIQYPKPTASDQRELAAALRRLRFDRS